MFHKQKSIPLVILLGIALLCGLPSWLGAMVMLWLNEGQVDWGTIGQQAQMVQADRDMRADANEGKFVAVTGSIILDRVNFVDDAPYLAAGPYLKLYRSVEMYAWKEEKRYSTRRGDSPELIYSNEWTSTPEISTRFVQSATHVNPSFPITHAQISAPQAYIGTALRANDNLGAYIIFPNRNLEFGANKILQLNSEMLGPQTALADNAVYVNKTATSEKPAQVGDVRLRYRAHSPTLVAQTGTDGKVVYQAVVQNQVYTMFGKQQGNRIEPYVYNDRQRLYRAVSGNFDEAIATLKNEYVTTLWRTRLFGLILSWFGAMMTLLPLTKGVAFLGQVKFVALVLISGVIAVPLSILVMVLSFLFNNPLAFVALILLAAIVGFFVVKAISKRQPVPL
jgi:hypothetical protein